MSTRAASVLKLAAVAFAVLLVSSLIALAVLVATPAGVRLAVAVLDRIDPAELSVGAIEGSLLAGVVLEDVRYAGDGVDAGLVVLEAEADWSALTERRLVLRRLELRGGQVRLAGDEPAAADAEPSDEAPALPDIPENLAVQRLALRDIAVLGAGPDDGLSITRLDGRLDGARLELTTIEATAAGATLDAAAELRVAGGDADGRAEGTLTLPAGTGDAASSPTVLFTAGFELAAQAEPWYAAIEWTRLTYRDSDGREWRSPSGRLVATPGAEPLGLELAARLESEALPSAVVIDAESALAGERLDVTRLEVDALGGELSADGALNLAERSGQLRVAYDGLDPSLIDERVDGRLSGRFDVAASAGEELRATASGELGGELGGRPLDGELIAGFSSDRLTIARADLRLDDGRVEAVGTLAADGADLSFSASLPRLADWHPAASGSLNARGRIVGETDDPMIDVELDGEGLAWEGLDLPPFERVEGAVAGTLEAHDARLRAVSELARASLRVEQGIRDGRVEGRLLEAVLALETAGTWRLVSEAAYAVGEDEMTLERACYAGPEEAGLCASLREETLSVEAQDLPNQLAAPWLAEDIRIEGAADARLELSWSGPLRGELELSQPSLAVRAANGEDGAAPESERPAGDGADGAALTELADIMLTASLDEERLSGRLAATLAATGDPLNGELTLSPPSAEGALDGRLTGRLTDLTLLAAFVDGVEQPGGELEASVTVGGTLAEPALSGRVTGASLSAALPPLGIEVADGRLAAEAGTGGSIRFDGEICSQGCVALTGMLETGDNWSLTAGLDGEGFEVVDLDDMRAVVSPELELRGSAEQWRASGALEIGEGFLDVEDVPRTAVRPAEETVVHERTEPADGEEPELPVPLTIDIDASLGDVMFRGLGVEAELDGLLDIERTAEGQWLAQGTTEVEEGSFSAYGQELTIERGLLIFTGPPDNPSLDIRATRMVEGAVVGVSITGTASNPQSMVFSDPAMPESEAFARLVTGRSLEGGGDVDPEALERAALGLGLRRAVPTLNRIGEGLGLEELGVESDGESDGALVAGTQLGDDVYLRYRYGLFDDFAGLELIYQITERFRLRTETGMGQSLDLIYQVGGDDEPGPDEDDTTRSDVLSPETAGD